MPEETENKKTRHLWILFLCIALVIVCGAGAVVVIWLANREAPSPKPTQPATQVTTQATDPTEPSTESVTEPSTVPTEPAVEKVASATVVSMGDILMHGPVRDTYITKFFPDTVVGEEFNYEPIFAGIQDIIPGRITRLSIWRPPWPVWTTAIPTPVSSALSMLRM